MKLYFIRHGQSTNNLLSINDNAHRKADPGLSEKGKEQVKVLSQYLSANRKDWSAYNESDCENFYISHIYSSPMIRALDTAQAVSNALGITPVIWEDLHEGGGIWLENQKTKKRIGQPGPNREFFKKKYPSFILPEKWNDTGWWNRPYETPLERRTRASKVFQKIQENHVGHRHGVILVSHHGFYNSFMKTILGMSCHYPDFSIWFDLNNAAITFCDFRDKQIRVAYQNKFDFLPPNIVTSLLERF